MSPKLTGGFLVSLEWSFLILLSPLIYRCFTGAGAVDSQGWGVSRTDETGVWSGQSPPWDAGFRKRSREERQWHSATAETAKGSGTDTRKLAAGLFNKDIVYLTYFLKDFI